MPARQRSRALESSSLPMSSPARAPPCLDCCRKRRHERLMVYSSNLEAPPMDISLSQELEQFIKEKVSAGRYSSPSDVVQNALLRLKRDESGEKISTEEMEEMIAVGQAEADRGELLDADAVFEELRRHSAARRGESR